jgi:hypothetical protein
LIVDACASGIARTTFDRHAAGVADRAALGVLFRAALRRAADTELVLGMEGDAVLARATLGDMARPPVCLAARAAHAWHCKDCEHHEEDRQRFFHDAPFLDGIAETVFVKTFGNVS